MDLLRFIAPWVQGIRLRWLASKPGSYSNQVSQVIRALEGGWEGLAFPALREIEVGRGDLELPPPRGLDIAATILVKELISRAKGLTWYHQAILFAVDGARQAMLMSDVIRAFPSSLKRLGIWLMFAVDFGVLSNCHFQLEEYWHPMHCESSTNDVFALLRRQAGTLRTLQMRVLEHLYQNAYPTFPLFPLVTRLLTDVSPRSRFGWIGKFPSLHHLELNHRCGDASIDLPEMTNPEDIFRLSHHQGVRSITIRPYPGESIVRFDILRHLFPNLTVLHLKVNWSFESELAHLLTHMTELEVLKLTWELVHAGLIPFVHPDLEAILCGLPLRVEEGEPAVVDRPLFGLENLKKLKRLDVTGGSTHFERVLTPLTLYHVFRRMGELKELRLNEAHPQAVEVATDIIQELKADGVEVDVRKCSDD